MASRVIITFPFCLGTGGGGTIHCEQLALHLKAQGTPVTVLPVAVRWGTRNETQTSALETRLKDNSIDVVRVRPHPAHYALDGLEVKKQISRIEAQERVQGVLSFWTEAAFLPGFLRSRRIPFGIIAAASYAERFGGGRRTALGFVRDHLVLWRPLRNADAVFANSQFTRKQVIALSRAPEDRVHVTYCGIEPRFRQVQRMYGGPVERLIFYGHLTALKGVFDILAALGELTRRGVRNWKLKIAGWGDAEPVRRSAEKHGVAGQVEVLGPLTRNQLMTELEWAQLAILPSYAESFGMAAVESQAAGLPVVAYDVGGVSETIDHGNTGWLIPRGRADLLADAIAEAIQSPEQTFQKGIAARHRSGIFSWERVARTILTNIEELHHAS